MKVGIIGSGVVGQTLAARFVKHHHEVEIGTRDPAKLKDWAAKSPAAKVKSSTDTASFGDVVVLAEAGEATLDTVKQAGAAARRRGTASLDGFNRDRLAHRPGQQGGEAPDQSVQIDPRWGQHLLTGEGEQTLGRRSGPPNALDRRSNWPADGSYSLRRKRARRRSTESRLPITMVIRLLKSCATPRTSRPIDSVLWV